MTDHIPDARKKLVEVVALNIQSAEEWPIFWSHDDACKLAQVALLAIEAAGYRIVPVEPTEEMMLAGREPVLHYECKSPPDMFSDCAWVNGEPLRATGGFTKGDCAVFVYRAMLAAAPKVVP